MTTNEVSGATSVAQCQCIEGFALPMYGTQRCVSLEIQPLEIVSTVRLNVDFTDFTHTSDHVDVLIHTLASLAHLTDDSIIISDVRNTTHNFVVVEFRIVPETNTMDSAQKLATAVQKSIRGGALGHVYTGYGARYTNATFESVPQLQIERVPLQSYFSHFTTPVDSFDRDLVTQLCLDWSTRNHMDIAMLLQHNGKLHAQTCARLCANLKASGPTPLVPEYNHDKWIHPYKEKRIPEVHLGEEVSEEMQRDAITTCYGLCRTSGLPHFVAGLARPDGDMCLAMFNWL